MIDLVVSDAQRGVPLAALSTARAAGIATGGWMAYRFVTRDGPRPEFAELYGMRERPTRGYRDRTMANIKMADMTVWLGPDDSPGVGRSRNDAVVMCKRRFRKLGFHDDPRLFVQYCRIYKIRTINFVGQTEVNHPAYRGWRGIAAQAEDWLVRAWEFEREQVIRLGRLERLAPSW